MNLLVGILLVFTFSLAGEKEEVKQTEFMTGLDKAPPMPDEDENNKTILGIDTNKNGIRDDVEVYIHENFKGKDKYYERMLAFQYAYYYNLKFSKSYENIKKVRNETRVLGMYTGCANYIYMKFVKNLKKTFLIDQEIVKVKSLILNNKDRLTMNSSIDSLFSGTSAVMITGDQGKEFCLFKTEGRL